MRIEDKFELLKGQMVLYDDKVCHFIGIGEDDHDYFYILTHSHNFNGHKLILGSPISGVWQLKDKIDERHYRSLVYSPKLNCRYSYDFLVKRSVEEEQFRLFVAHEKQLLIDKILAPRSKGSMFNFGDNKIIGQLCWEFN